jgi:hypothetical protein
MPIDRTGAIFPRFEIPGFLLFHIRRRDVQIAGSMFFGR